MDQSTGIVLHRPKNGYSLLRSVGTSLLATAVFLPCAAFLFTFIAYNTENPSALIPTFAYVAALTSSLFCGFLSARLRKKQGLLCGLLSGGGMLILFLVALFIFAGDGELHMGKVLFTDIPVFLLALLGGIIGGTRRAPKRRRVRR